jgi:UDP-N-acetylmuramyl pentapeptide phosphotransferase/UDP-N-acetylglucosamine-1-phosphate transferase
MGDTGSQTLGLVVGVLAVGQMMNTGTELATKDLVLILSPLLIPVFDVIHVMLLRMLGGCHPFHPDMTHIHHRLLQRGLNPSQALIFIVFMTVVYILVNTLLALFLSVTLILIADVVLWCMFNHYKWRVFTGHTATHRLHSTKANREQKRY